MPEISVDVAVIGGGTGGVAAALAALEAGCRVVLTEETDWVGGQFTAQAVPPDEHPWIEQFGATRSYRRLRGDIRDYYRRYYPLTTQARQDPHLNPGGGYVSRLCHEPRVSLAVLQAYLQPHLAAGRLMLLLRHSPVAATTDSDRVGTVAVRSSDTHETTTIRAAYFIDATELGDLVELTHTEYVIGAEAQAETGEPHAVDGPAQPLNQQAVSHCFALSHHPGEDHTIARPAQYDFWRDYRADFWPDKLLSWRMSHPITLEARDRVLLPEEEAHSPYGSLWRFRQILDPSRFEPDTMRASITLVNWPQIDYWLGPLVGVPETEVERHRAGARQLSLAFLYWMQTEAPRPDGGTGYPGLRLRPDVTDTEDGLAKTVYVRESRRIRAEFTVVEQHVAAALRPDGAEKFDDSVGVGCYRIDLHPGTGNVNYIDVGCWPFQIPLGSLIPARMENLLPGCKNLGVTHITNGCYRLHPVEWNIGEAAGALAAHCLWTKQSPRAVRNQVQALRDFQAVLAARGVELDWPRLYSV